jgi:LmbE family N-acetylglucosaminyl deacetylase
VVKAVESLGEQAPLFYSTHAAYPGHPRPRLANPDDPAHLVLDVSKVQVRKTNAVSCHRTQHSMFIRNTSRDLGREVTLQEVVLLEESLHRVHPPVHNGDQISDLVLDSLEKYRKQ